MNKKNLKFFLCFMCIVFIAPQVLAGVEALEGGGGGISFPLSCEDFSGKWCSEKGQLYQIVQKKCDRLTILAVHQDGSSTIIRDLLLDNSTRKVKGLERRQESFIRNRWNSLRYGTIIETYIQQIDSEKITNKVELFQYIGNVLLQSKYHFTTKRYPRGKETHQGHSQKVFYRYHGEPQMCEVRKESPLPVSYQTGMGSFLNE